MPLLWMGILQEGVLCLEEKTGSPPCWGCVSSDLTCTHRTCHFKELAGDNIIEESVLKTADNHLRILFSHHLYRHNGTHFPYFDYYKKRIVYYTVQEMVWNALNKYEAEKKSILEAKKT